METNDKNSAGTNPAPANPPKPVPTPQDIPAGIEELLPSASGTGTSSDSLSEPPDAEMELPKLDQTDAGAKPALEDPFNMGQLENTQEQPSAGKPAKPLHIAPPALPEKPIDATGTQRPAPSATTASHTQTEQAHQQLADEIARLQRVNARLAQELQVATQNAAAGQQTPPPNQGGAAAQTQVQQSPVVNQPNQPAGQQLPPPPAIPPIVRWWNALNRRMIAKVAAIIGIIVGVIAIAWYAKNWHSNSNAPTMVVVATNQLPPAAIQPVASLPIIVPPMPVTSNDMHQILTMRAMNDANAAHHEVEYLRHDVEALQRKPDRPTIEIHGDGNVVNTGKIINTGSGQINIGPLPVVEIPEVSIDVHTNAVPQPPPQANTRPFCMPQPDEVMPTVTQQVPVVSYTPFVETYYVPSVYIGGRYHYPCYNQRAYGNSSVRLSANIPLVPPIPGIKTPSVHVTVGNSYGSHSSGGYRK